MQSEFDHAGFLKVEHIGIAVKSLEEGERMYNQLLGVEKYKTEEVAAEGVITAFYLVGDTKIELLEPTRPDSAIARFLAVRGPGLHHIAYEVLDIQASVERLRKAGFIFTREEPFRGADNKLVIFIHPKSAGGTLVELCQEIRTQQPEKDA
jgi:methylmalonyl-CoA/ethylmalonyl-CoA epimerase